MNCPTLSMAPIGKPEALDAQEAWVHEVLEPDQLTASKMRYGRRNLSRGMLLLLWTLRVYVVFMAFIISLAVWNALHAAG